MKSLLTLFPLLFLLFGCSTKHHYKSGELEKKVDYQKRLPAQIIESNLAGSTLSNGGVIVKTDGVSKPVLKEGFHLIGSGENYIIASSRDGDVTLISKDAVEIFTINIKSQGVSASFNERDLIALLTYKNELILINIDSQKVVFKHKEKISLTSTSDIAAPIFFEDLILFPTLNGKVIVLDEKKKQIGRDFIINSEKYFSNISYLEGFKNRIIIGTKEKAIAIGGETLGSIEDDIRFLIDDEKELFMLTVDGRVVTLDQNLKEKNSIKFPFARFAGVSQTEDKLIIIEHSGYVIVLDKNLKSYKTYETPDNFDDFFFLDKTKLYYGRKLIDFAKIN